MRRVLATAGHVDHGKSTLVRALTGRDPDRLADEKSRGLTIELGFAWTRLAGGADVAFVDVPGHQRFIGTMLAGLGPSPAVVFVVAADQGWQAQSSEHLAAVQALGIGDGLLVVTRADLAGVGRRAAVAAEATERLAEAGLEIPAVTVSATTGEGMDHLRAALDALVARMPEPDAQAPVRLWSDRSFAIRGAGTVVTGTLGAGTIRTGDRLTLLDRGRADEVTVRGLHSEDEARESIGPVSRAAVNLRRVDDVGRSVVLLTPGAFELATTIDVALAPMGGEGGVTPPGANPPREMRPPGANPPREMRPPEEASLHIGSTSVGVHVRPLSPGWARLAAAVVLPWRVGDRAILRDPGSRRIWSVRVADVDPLPLRRRGAAGRRGMELASGEDPSRVRLRSRSAERAPVLERLGLPEPAGGVRVGQWWLDPRAHETWRSRLAEHVADHHRRQPLSAGVPVAEAARGLDLPGHLPGELGPELVRHLAAPAGLAVDEGRVHDPRVGGLGAAEAGVVTLEQKLRAAPFAAPERDELTDLGLGPTELAAAERMKRLVRVTDDIVLLPDGPARAMRELARLEQPFTLSQARQALGTTRRVAVPLLEHLDGRGWTRRVDARLREVVRPR